MDPGAVLAALLGSPNVASRRWLYEQYDWHVGARTVAGPGRGAGVVRVPGTRKALVAATDAVARVGAADPWLGAVLSVAEATRNVAVTGARPLGVTNCLNFGDPTRPEAFWQLSEAVRGLGDACRALGLPVTGGNVSLYNESPDGAILPTPEIGVVGLLDDVGALVRPAFGAHADVVLLVGEATPGLGGSEYARIAGPSAEDGAPTIDLERERRLQAFLRDAAERRLPTAAEDISTGGLAVALAEMAIRGCRGGSLRVPTRHSPAVELFGESPSRAVVTCAPGDADTLVALARRHGLPIERIGVVGGDRLVVELAGAGATGGAEERGESIADPIDVAVADLARVHEAGLPRALGLAEGEVA
jgi:phosphoribosylformylglycinamidine synthase